MKQYPTATECYLPYGITQCYLSPDTSEYTRLNPSHTGRYSIYLPQRDGRLSWPRWLVTYWDGLPVHRRTSIQVLTGYSWLGVKLTTCWSPVWRPNTTPPCHYRSGVFGGQLQTVTEDISIFAVSTSVFSALEVCYENALY